MSELHWGSIRKYIRFSMSGKQAMKNSVPSKVLGRPISTLAPEDKILVFCIHNGTKHHWHRLRIICDMARIFKADDTLDWDRLVDRSHSLGIQPALGAGLLLARDLLGATASEAVSGAAQRNARAQKIAREIESAMFEERENPPHAIQFHSVSLKLREKILHRLMCIPHITREILAPSDKEELIVRGRGPAVALLRVVIKPFRLLGKYLALLNKQAG